MRKTLVYLLVLAVSFTIVKPSFCADINDWKRGDGSNAIKGTTSPSDIDTVLANYSTDPLDKALTHRIWGCELTVTNVTTITVEIGEVVCSNSGGTVKRFRENTSTTTMVMTTSGVGGIDSGSSEKASTWYDLYAVADADATTFTAIATEQGTAPSDVTYYRYIGSFYNDAGQDIDTFYFRGKGSDPVVMWDVPVSITTTVSAAAWSAATSCAAGMPSHSELGIFGLEASDNDNTCQLIIRPNGSTWNTAVANSIYLDATGTGDSSNVMGGQRLCATDGSQQIQYYNLTGDASTTVSVEGFILER